LRQLKRQEDVDLKVPTNEINWNFPDRPSLAHAGIVPKHVDVKVERLGNIIGIRQIETFDSEIILDT